MNGMGDRRAREPLLYLVLTAVGLVWSGWGALDPLTWKLEVFPIFLAAPVLIWTYKRFPLTPLLYRLMFLHVCILMLGGHYTYADVPLGEWLKDTFHMARNPYDRIGHFVQGFVPALIVRELLLRTSPLKRGKWMFFLVCSVCLALSACYEFIEWLGAIVFGGGADAFLGTQGDVWDTQWDMLLALVGALTAQLTLAGVQDRMLRKLLSRGDGLTTDVDWRFERK